MKKFPSYPKDSTEFLKLIEITKLPHHCLLASIDVSSLYTNIPHDDGKQNVLYYLQNNPDNYAQPEQSTSEVLTELIDIVLKNNVFEFNNKIYYFLQIQGINRYQDGTSICKPLYGKIRRKIDRSWQIT